MKLVRWDDEISYVYHIIPVKKGAFSYPDNVNQNWIISAYTGHFGWIPDDYIIK